MTHGKKIQWLLRLSAGVAIVALSAGCATNQNDGLVHGERFLSNDSDRPVYQFNDAEAANATRADATIRAYHFDGDVLNSLGEERLDLMLRAGQMPTPLMVYLDLPATDANTAPRKAALTAYLKDRGLTDDQIVIKSGPNPDVNSPVAPLLAAQTGGQPPAGGAATGGH